MTGLFDGAGPRWFNIPAHRPFVEDLARGLFDALAADGPLALSRAIVLTPTRRAARALGEAFVGAAGGRPILPPQIRPLGDLDLGEPPFEPGELALDLPAAVSPLRRRFELARLVVENEPRLGRALSAAGALELADALGGFLDSLQIEELDPADGLAHLVDADLAEHWRASREFLEHAIAAWPRRLAELGLADVSARRVALLRKLADQWRRNPPAEVLLAAGSTGTAPATADLLTVIAAAPRGAVVTPGLDDSLADSAWRQVGEQHPQGALRRLLERAGTGRDAVAVWPASHTLDSQGRWRRRIVNEALRPAEATADWLEVIKTLRREGQADGVDPLAEGLKGLSLVAARTEEEAALTAALLLREALETPGRTAALVAPDQTLARRVTAQLARWGVVPDSSAGHPLAGCACGVLASLCAQAAVDPAAPVALLALLKHPYARLGMTPDALAAARAALERHGLRGPRRGDWAGIAAALDADIVRRKPAPETAEAARALLARVRDLLGDAEPLDAVRPVAARAADLARLMEATARSPDGDLGALWAGPGGEALARLIAGLIDESDGLPPVTPRGFAELLAALMAGESVRESQATHPRLRILGAIEARLIRADLVVLAGLEEGVWPQGASVDPFLSRPMRERLGLPPPERRIGLAAHDFAQAACAPEVVLLHSERREGAPAVKSRWLWRLETLARGAGVAIPGRPDVLAWARALDAPGEYRPAVRPAPRPPVEARPREMAVTRIEALTRDPYAVWARDILRFYPLDRPDEPVEARARGTAIHAAFEAFALAHPDAVPEDAADIFRGLYVDALRDAGMPAEALAREGALAREAAQWVADLEARRRAGGTRVHVEQFGSLTLALGGGAFTLTARADRIEATTDGLGHILDYKTGKAPSKKMVETGFSPQLTLTAAILAAGGFATLGRLAPGELVYLEVTGRKPAGREERRAAPGDEAQDAADHALAGLKDLIDRYDDAAQAYASRTAPQFVHAHDGDYDHLARVFEWSTSGDEEGEA